MSLFTRIFSPTYHNTGSVARDHLALERTFLAWLRTGLGFIALGMAVERFNQLDPSLFMPPSEHKKTASQHQKEHKHKEEALVLALLGTGCGSILYASVRYFSTMRMLERNLYRPAYHGAGVLSVAVASLAGGAYWSNATRHEERDREEAATDDKHRKK